MLSARIKILDSILEQDGIGRISAIGYWIGQMQKEANSASKMLANGTPIDEDLLPIRAKLVSELGLIEMELEKLKTA